MEKENRLVVYLWVHQIESSGKNANNSLYYNGDTIYSHDDFPIARCVNNNVVLYTTLGRSTYTTAKHMYLVRSASIRSTKKVFDVPNVMATTKLEHKGNYQVLIKAYKKSLELYARSRLQTIAQAYLLDAENLLTDANEYTKLFKLGYREKVFGNQLN